MARRIAEAQPAWDRERALQWQRFAPPARPSAAEISAYDLALGPETRELVILGSTPELRSLARRRGIRTVCVDVSRGVFNALSSLATGEGSERLLLANWLELETKEVFDAAAGDGAINMLPRDRHPLFLERVAAALRPGGRALLRVHVVGPPAYTDPRAVVEAYRCHPDPGPFWTWTRTHFDMLWRDADDAVRFDRYHERIQALFDAGILRREERAAYENVAAVNAITLYYAEREVFEAQAAGHFEIESVSWGGDYEASRFHPLYVLVKRPAAS